MIEKLEKKQLREITIDTSKIIWIKKNKECLIGNVLFDVKEITFHDHLVTLKGLYDFEETALKENLSKNENGKESTRNLMTIIYKVLHESFYNFIHSLDKTFDQDKIIVNEFKNKTYSFQFCKNIFQPPSISSLQKI